MLTRSGGRPGDELYVSGTIGAAAAGLEMLRQQPGSPVSRPSGLQCNRGQCVHRRYRRPEPRVRLGRAVAQARAARAAMDLSDGLADAVRAAGRGERMRRRDRRGRAADRAGGAGSGGRDAGAIRSIAALSGGDDYELLIAVPRDWRGRLRTRARAWPSRR